MTAISALFFTMLNQSKVAYYFLSFPLPSLSFSLVQVQFPVQQSNHLACHHCAISGSLSFPLIPCTSSLSFFIPYFCFALFLPFSLWGSLLIIMQSAWRIIFEANQKAATANKKSKTLKLTTHKQKYNNNNNNNERIKNLKYFTTVSDKRREYLVATRRAQPSWLAYLQTVRHRQRGRATKWQTDWLTEWQSKCFWRDDAARAANMQNTSRLNVQRGVASHKAT